MYNYDFTNLKADTVKGDAAKRDFTINALSVDLTAYPKVKISDYLGGKQDIRKRTLRACGGSSFKDDPLRILRAFSLSCMYGLSMERKTLLLCKKQRNLLSGVSSERVTEELFKILRCSDSYSTIKKMSDSKILDVIFPQIKKMRGCLQGGFHHLDVWDHSLCALKKFEKLLLEIRIKGKFKDYLYEEISFSRTRLSLLKLACILHDVGKPKAKRKRRDRSIFYKHEKFGIEILEEIARRLRFSQNEKNALKTIIFWHLRPGSLVQGERISERAVYRYFRDTASEGAGILLLSVADWRATSGPMSEAK